MKLNCDKVLIQLLLHRFEASELLLPDSVGCRACSRLMARGAVSHGCSSTSSRDHLIARRTTAMTMASCGGIRGATRYNRKRLIVMIELNQISSTHELRICLCCRGQASKSNQKAILVNQSCLQTELDRVLVQQ